MWTVLVDEYEILQLNTVYGKGIANIFHLQDNPKI